MSLTPAINFRLFGYFWPVSSTPGNTGDKFFAVVNDTGDKTVLTIRKEYLRPPGSDAAADGVTGTNMKRRMYRHHTQWLEAPESAKTTSNQNYDIPGRRSRTRPPIVSFEPPWIPAVVVTGDKFINGINDTGDHWKSPVSLTPLINIHSRISPRIFEKIRNGPKGILMGPGDTDSWKNLKSKISCQTPLYKYILCVCIELSRITVFISIVVFTSNSDIIYST